MTERVLDVIGPAVPYIIGFALGYLSFELTEWRRRRIRNKATRRALQTELEAVDAVLGAIVFRLSIGTENVTRAVQEIRRFYSEGRERILMVDAPNVPADFLQRSDEELAQILRQWRPMESTIGVSVATSVLDTVLSSAESYLSPEQLQAMATVRWHGHLLAHEAEWMNRWLQMTFEIEDPTNHTLVVANHKKAQANYRQRAEIMLDAVREVLRRLRDHP